MKSKRLEKIEESVCAAPLICIVIALCTLGLLWISKNISFVDGLNSYLMVILVFVTTLYLLETRRIAKATEKQSREFSKQTKINAIEKQLECFYNPLADILKRLKNPETKEVPRDEDMHRMRKIFEEYSYLGTKDIRDYCNKYGTAIASGEEDGEDGVLEPLYNLPDLIEPRREELIDERLELIDK